MNDYGQLLEVFTYVGEFVVTKKNNIKNLIDFERVLTTAEMKNNKGRVYVFAEVINGEVVDILKIGKSSAKSGLNGTIGCYSTALSGTPGPNRFCIHYMIYDKLNSGSQIMVYVRFTESVKRIITGLYSEIEVEVPLDVTYIENLCLVDYKNKFGTYPTWNFQERGETLPIYLMEKFGTFIKDKKTI